MRALFSDLLPPIFYQKKVPPSPTSRPSEHLRNADDASAFPPKRSQTHFSRPAAPSLTSRKEFSTASSGTGPSGPASPVGSPIGSGSAAEKSQAWAESVIADGLRKGAARLPPFAAAISAAQAARPRAIRSAMIRTQSAFTCKPLAQRISTTRDRWMRRRSSRRR